MSPAAVALPDGGLDADDRRALVALGEHLWPARDAIAAAWTEALVAARPQDFQPHGPVAVEALATMNATFLALVVDHLRRGDLPGLTATYYEMNRRLVNIEAERQMGRQVTLADLYRSAHLALVRLEAHAGKSAALGKLAAHLMTLVGLAYSDAREAALEAARDQLEAVVAERTAALAKEKALAENIIEALPGVFYVFDADGRFLRWNRNFATVSQYDDAAIARLHPTELFDGEDQAYIAARIADVFRNGHATAEADFVARDGSRRPHFFSGHRILVDGRPCCIGMGIDVTERKEAEAALQRARAAQQFAALLESAPDAVVASDGGGAIVFANTQAERLFDRPRQALLGQPLGALIPDALGASRRAAPSARVTVEAEACRRDGTRVPVEITLRTLETTDGPVVTSAIRDITDRRRAEEEIHRLTAELERRVAARTAELARSNADLEQFAYVASHDLQEPLRAVASYTQLLARRYRERLDGDALRFLDRAGAAVTRMQALIRDLLAYSRVGTRGGTVESVDLDAVLADVLDDLQPSIAEAGALITHAALPRLPGDASQLRQLLQNLIGNAIKFRADAAPRVHLAAARAGDAWELSVEDNGIGIEPEYHERVFVIFQRLHGRRDYPGTGVGLAICKKIVERHGGRIWIAAAPGGGTRVCFTLPAAATAAAARAVAAG